MVQTHGHTGVIAYTGVNSALHPFGVAKSSTSFGCMGKGGNVTSAGWQVTLGDPIRHVSSRIEARTGCLPKLNRHTAITFFFTFTALRC